MNPNHSPTEEPEKIVSLDELARAFAEVMGHSPARAAAEATGQCGDQPDPRADGSTEDAPRRPASAAARQSGIAPTDETTNDVQPARSPGRHVGTDEDDEPYETGEDDRQAARAAISGEDAVAWGSPSDEEEADGPVDPAAILEALLFVGSPDGSPLRPAQAAALMRGVEVGEIPELVARLNQRYAARECPYWIVGEGPGYRLTLREPYARLRHRFHGRVRPARLSQAAVDVLAIVAYQQPISADEINRQRGKPSGHVLAQLVHRGLLRIERAEPPRRCATYRTTERFLTLFNLRSLDDLPRGEEIERM